MSDARGRSGSPADDEAREAAARERVEAVLDGFNRLSPDELARIGLSRRDPTARAALLRTASNAARDAGREELFAETRRRARDTILRRYQQGAIHPTWITLNWGLSQGTTEDRVAIIDALQDAATAAVVVDLVDPEVTDALTGDAAQVLGLATGMAFEGSLDRALPVEAFTAADAPVRLSLLVGVMLVTGVAMAASGLTTVLMPLALMVGVVVALIVRYRARRQSDDRAGADDG
jgi:hypothetical protein